MKILYQDNHGEKHLQEMHLVERGTSVIKYDGTRTPAFEIINKNEGDLMSAFLDVLKENEWHGKTLRHALDYADELIEEKQTVFFGGNCCLKTIERDAFWLAVKDAFKKGEKLFDIEEWFTKYEEEIRKE